MDQVSTSRVANSSSLNPGTTATVLGLGKYGRCQLQDISSVIDKWSQTIDDEYLIRAGFKQSPHVRLAEPQGGYMWGQPSFNIVSGYAQFLWAHGRTSRSLETTGDQLLRQRESGFEIQTRGTPIHSGTVLNTLRIGGQNPRWDAPVLKRDN